LVLQDHKNFIIAHKPAGLLTMDDSGKEESLQQRLEEAGHKDLHFLSRLDRPVSGLLVCAKTKRFLNRYLLLQKQGKVSKYYLAFVEKNKEKTLAPSSTLKHYHRQNSKTKKAHINDEAQEGFKRITLEYLLLEELDNYYLIQLSHIGFPIKGDVKYGARRRNRDRTIHLHAYKLEWAAGDGVYRVSAPIPDHDSLWKVAHNTNID